MAFMQPVGQPHCEQENTDNGQLRGMFENDFSYYYVVQYMYDYVD